MLRIMHSQIRLVNSEGGAGRSQAGWYMYSHDAEHMRTNWRINATAQLLRCYLGHYSQSTTSQQSNGG